MKNKLKTWRHISISQKLSKYVLFLSIFFFIKSYKVKILNEKKGYFSTFNFQIHAKS